MNKLFKYLGLTLDSPKKKQKNNKIIKNSTMVKTIAQAPNGASAFISGLPDQELNNFVEAILSQSKNKRRK